MTTRTREIHLASRPSGWPTPENFRTVETDLPDPGAGQVLVRNTWMSVDPYMRGRMNDTRSYVPPFRLDAPLEGGAVGEVVASAVRVVDGERVPASAYLGVLGMPGLTAYVGLTRIAGLREGDRVLVSGAAGAVGSAVGQLARLLGASAVVGSAGSAEKIAWLTEELGFDAAVNYKDGPVGRLLAPHGPFDVYFDNVGGDHLEAAIGHLAEFGRIAACGAIAQYNDTEASPGPRNMAMFVTKRLTMRGFIVSDHAEAASEFYERAGAWVAEGRLTSRETVADGLDHAVDAFLDLMRGANTGKMLVRL